MGCAQDQSMERHRQNHLPEAIMADCGKENRDGNWHNNQNTVFCCVDEIII